MKKKFSLAMFFTLVAIPVCSAELRLASPNGGEEICLGRPFRITWTATAVAARVKLQLIHSGGGLVGVIASNLDAGAQGFDWPQAGQHAGGTATAGANYKVRIMAMDGALADQSDAAFTLKTCSGGVHAGDLQVSQPPTPQVSVNQPPDLQVSRAQTPQVDIARAPKLEVARLWFDWRSHTLLAAVRNVGNAPFIGEFQWWWSTDCGNREGSREIREWFSPQLETEEGVICSLACPLPSRSCSRHARLEIRPVAKNGTVYPYSSMEKDLPCFEKSQFLLADERIRLIFLHGASWVNNAHEYVISSADAFDYDPQTKKATFFIGVPIRNCGGEAGTADHDPDNRLWWWITHSPSNYEPYWQFLAQGNSYASSPIAPGQGMLVERAVSLEVKPGIYLLHVHQGSAHHPSIGFERCVISIRFADNLIH